MPIPDYGVLKCTAIEGVMERDYSSPHYQVHVVADTTHYRVPVNVRSQVAPSEVLYLIDENFTHEITAGLRELTVGFTPLKGQSVRSLGLDYVRSNLFDPRKMVPLPHDLPGTGNDLNEKIDFHIKRAIRVPDAELYAFGSRWKPNNRPAKPFTFIPDAGVHDIHMNQGNVDRWKNDDGIYQDGGLLIYYPQENKWTGIFLAFQSQSFTTDEKGHHIPGVPLPDIPVDIPVSTPTPAPAMPEPVVKIIAAMINPVGEDGGKECVLLINTMPHPIDLTGWFLVNKQGIKHTLEGELDAGDMRKVVIPGLQGFLANRGGIITLQDANGIKVDGVKYTREQASEPGRTIIF